MTVTMTEWRRDERTGQRALLDGVLILPPGADEPLHLNPSAAEIWAAVAQHPTPDALTAALATRHGLDDDAMRAAVDGALAHLASVGALHAVDAAGAAR